MNKQQYRYLLLTLFCLSVPSFIETLASNFSRVHNILSKGDVTERQNDADGNCLLGEVQ